MFVVHPATLCDVCFNPYIIGSSEPANSPHAIVCGHIFCLTCLRNISPSACPLCRKSFQPDRIRKLHVAGPPELDGAATIDAGATQLLQCVALVSGEDVSDVEVIEVVTEVEEWLSSNSAEDNSVALELVLAHGNGIMMTGGPASLHRPLRAALAALRRYKALQERNERDHAEHRRVYHELAAYRRNAHQDPQTSRAVEESLLGRIDEIESSYALEASHTDPERGLGTVRLTHVFQLSRLHAEIKFLRGDAQQPYRNVSNPLHLRQQFPVALSIYEGSLSC
ncbi:hypothetical protein OG21DRAFT_1489144 [Imleria badia]|nr:hypothetical protein OG21DRAFT_1489144 [Imleria badia]